MGLGRLLSLVLGRRYGYKAQNNAEYEAKTEEIRQQMSERGVVVTRDHKFLSMTSMVELTLEVWEMACVKGPLQVMSSSDLGQKRPK